jgi:putative membrane protein
MIRLLLRSISINALGIYLTIQILSGAIYYVGGFKTIFIAALLISLANLIVRPLVNLLLLPVHILTLGAFRWVTNLVTLYLVTLIEKDLIIHPFTSPRLDLSYAIIPPITFSSFGSFVLVTITLTLVFHFIYWLFQD